MRVAAPLLLLVLATTCFAEEVEASTAAGVEESAKAEATTDEPAASNDLSKLLGLKSAGVAHEKGAEVVEKNANKKAVVADSRAAAGGFAAKYLDVGKDVQASFAKQAMADAEAHAEDKNAEKTAANSVNKGATDEKKLPTQLLQTLLAKQKAAMTAEELQREKAALDFLTTKIQARKEETKRKANKASAKAEKVVEKAAEKVVEKATEKGEKVVEKATEKGEKVVEKAKKVTEKGEAKATVKTEKAAKQVEEAAEKAEKFVKEAAEKTVEDVAEQADKKTKKKKKKSKAAKKDAPTPELGTVPVKGNRGPAAEDK